MPYQRGLELEQVYEAALRGGYGFIASNITHPDILVGQLEGAAVANSDVVLQVKRDTAAYVGNGDPVAGLHALGEYVRRLAESLDVGVFLNADHVRPDDAAFLRACIDSGVPSSIMVDASDEPFEENVARTRGVVERIRDADQDLLVEAELGTIAGTEGGIETENAFYTDPAEAAEFVERTGCDLLAVSIGTEHGVSTHRDLDLRPMLATHIAEALAEHGLEIPLVVHGSSGLSRDQVETLLATGVCKLNTNTRYQYEYARTAAAFYRDHETAIVPPEDVKDDPETFFSGAEWSPDKSVFDPQVVGREIRDRIGAVMAEFCAISGSADRSLYA